MSPAPPGALWGQCQQHIQSSSQACKVQTVQTIQNAIYLNEGQAHFAARSQMFKTQLQGSATLCCAGYHLPLSIGIYCKCTLCRGSHPLFHFIQNSFGFYLSKVMQKGMLVLWGQMGYGKFREVFVPAGSLQCASWEPAVGCPLVAP